MLMYCKHPRRPIFYTTSCDRANFDATSIELQITKVLRLTDVKNLHVRWAMNVKRDFKDIFHCIFRNPPE